MSKRVLSLALRVTGDASGVRLTPVERALQRLGEETEKVGKVFTKFAEDSEVGRLAQEQFAQQSASLTEALRQGTISSQEYAQRFSELADSAQRQAAALEEGRRITLATRTEEEKRTAELANLDRLLKANAIDQQAYTRAVAQASGANQAAAESARVRAAAEAEAARASAAAEAEAQRIRAANLTAQEQFDQAIGRANELRLRGLLTQEEFNRELERQAAVFARNVEAADNLGDAIGRAGDQTLKFNELSGILSVLPGPLGSIAGRISGIASASQGLARVFSTGLAPGVASVTSSLAGLLTPTTLAVAGIAALGAAANAIVNGLTALEDRVEKLGNTAAKLGVSFQFIQTLEESARRSGTSIDAVSAAFGRLQNSVLGVDEESKKAQRALSEIGVTAAELQRLSPEQQYDRIAKAVGSIEDPARRTATAIALFGRAGADLVPFFNNIDKSTRDVERFGAAISDIDRSRVDSLGDSFDGLFVSFRALGQSLLLPFAGVVDGIVKLFSGLINIVTSVAQVIGFVLGPVLDTVGKAFGVFGDAINSTVGFFRSFFGGSQDAVAAAEQISDAVERTAEETKALERAFESSNKSLDSVIAKAGEFGQAGFDAALQFQTALEELQAQADEGELNAEQYTRAVANATAEFEKQISLVKEVADENKKLAQEAERRAQAEADAIQRVIETTQEQLRIEREFGSDSGRFRASQNLLVITQEITRAEDALRAARQAGDQAAIDSLTSRLATLDQLAAREQDIASGARKAREEAEKENERLAKRREQLETQANNRIAQAREKLFERQYQIERQRADELSTVREGSVKSGDIREAGGIAAFFEALKEDPAIAEAKRQTQELQGLRRDIQKLEAEKVDILAGVG